MSFEGNLTNMRDGIRQMSSALVTQLTQRRPPEWNSPHRNYVTNLGDPDWVLLNLPQPSATRVDTQCVFCRRRIWRGQDRYKYSTGFSRKGNYKHTWFQLHQHCYFALVQLSIEKLRSTLPSQNKRSS